jgi:uncharacterized protein involved in exopolysaccharide biosynthesis
MVKDLIVSSPEPPAPDPAQTRKMVVDNVSRAVGVQNIRQSYVFNVTAVTKDPTKSALTADTLASLYIGSQVEAKLDAARASTQRLNERIAELKIELKNAERAAMEVNADADLVSPAALLALNRQIKDLRGRVVEAQSAQSKVATRLQELVQGCGTASAGHSRWCQRTDCGPARNRLVTRG